MAAARALEPLTLEEGARYLVAKKKKNRLEAGVLRNTIFRIEPSTGGPEDWGCRRSAPTDVVRRLAARGLSSWIAISQSPAVAVPILLAKPSAHDVSRQAYNEEVQVPWWLATWACRNSGRTLLVAISLAR